MRSFNFIFSILLMFSFNKGFSTEFFPGGNENIVVQVPIVKYKYFLVYQHSKGEHYNCRLTLDEHDFPRFVDYDRLSEQRESFSLILNDDYTVSIKFKNDFLMADKINKSCFNWRQWQYPVFDKMANLGHRHKDFKLVRAHKEGNDAYHIKFIDEDNVTSVLMVDESDGCFGMNAKAYFASEAYIGSRRPSVFILDPAIADKLNKTDGFGKFEKND